MMQLEALRIVIDADSSIIGQGSIQDDELDEAIDKAYQMKHDAIEELFKQIYRFKEMKK